MIDDPNPYSAPSTDPERRVKRRGRLGFFEKAGLAIGPCTTLTWAIDLILGARITGEFETNPGGVLMAAAFLFIVWGMVAAVSFAAIGRVIDYLLKRFLTTSNNQR